MRMHQILQIRFDMLKQPSSIPGCWTIVLLVEAVLKQSTKIHVVTLDSVTPYHRGHIE